MDNPPKRSERERNAYDTVDALHSRPWVHRRFAHVFRGPNALHGEELFFDTVLQRAQGGHVLEIGCGNGGVAERLVRESDATVYATDISSRQIEQAAARDTTDRLSFGILNADDPIDGRYDLIYGRGVLHHIEFRSVLERLATDNLNIRGSMVFREPLGANLLGAVYRTATRNDHTEDERPISADDLRWLARTFPGFWYYPYGFSSLPLGAISSLALKRPDNPLTRLGHKLDHGIFRNVSFMRPWFRAAVLVVDPG